jgi:VCBS repeat-containing protein
VDNLFATLEDTPLSVVLQGVLAGDTDIDGDVLTAILASGPSHGSLTLSPDGSLQYTPAANFHGTDSFTYRASDGAASSNLATVTIEVAAVNDAPTADAESYTLTQDAPLTVAAPGVLAGDGDVDGDSLTAVLVSGPTHGTLVLNANGSFTYTPAAGYVGPDSFSYLASDGTANSNPAVVSLSVASTAATTGKINANTTLDGGRRSFHINVQAQQHKQGIRYQGQFRFDDLANGVRLQSTAITHVRVGADGRTASFQGTATIGGVGGFTFLVTVEDGPGGDKFRVQIFGPGGYSYDSLDFALSGGLVDRGNIDIRPR